MSKVLSGNHKALYRKRHGFTLIELLVVLAVICIISAILFPVFARARENARRASCQSNLKQIVLGMLMYVQDYDEKTPAYELAPKEDASENNPLGWADALEPYVKSTQIFQCPSEETGGVIANANYQTQVASGRYSDYMLNVWTGDKSLATFAGPSMTVMILEGFGDPKDCPTCSPNKLVYGYRGSARHGFNGSTGSYTTSSYYGQGCPTSWTASTDVKIGTHLTIYHNDDLAALIHLDGSNYAFADGHVKWLKAATTSDGYKRSIVSNCAGTKRGIPTMIVEEDDQ
jgi:prepilin-type N-terminal cleavage/methylation domain-containing protein/prepilin-type processing-associated H-X9-DG protein